MARHCTSWLVAAPLLLVVLGVACAEETATVAATVAPVAEDAEHYPLTWASVDIKPVIDNDRLFKKYKACILVDNTKGCPRDVIQFKKILPEVLDTLCSKCLPEHVAKVKEALEYICQKRRADYDEVRNAKDPSGELQEKFQAKYGKINC